jgi:signal transduction histidine kinase
MKIQAMEKEAALKGIIFKLHGDHQTRLRVDREAFEKVAENLLSNAVKYTPEGSHSVVVEIQVEGNWLVVAFDDEGIGIPPKQQEKLFQDFFRATNAKTMEKFGTGLGLSIVKRILEWHGGQIKILSQPKEGTRVETWWPYSLT